MIEITKTGSSSPTSAVNNPPMARTFKTEKQRRLFELLNQFEDLIFACGPTGISTNVQGQFRIESFAQEDRLVLGDGNFHVHIDWERVKSAVFSVIVIGDRSEGVVLFKDGDESLFKFYRQSGDFPDEIRRFDGLLV